VQQAKTLQLIILEENAKLKGINMLGTGDFTHPKWLKELKANLFEVDGEGIFKTRGGEKFIYSLRRSMQLFINLME